MNAPVRITTETPEERAERLEYEAWEALRAEIEDEFADWVRNGIRGRSEHRDNPREYVDFSDWLIERAHRGGRYREAMDASERRLAPDLPSIVKGHKAYRQSEGWTR